MLYLRTKLCLHNSVVKNIPFLVVLGLSSSSDGTGHPMSFRGMSLEGELVYDELDSESGDWRRVPFLNANPLECVGCVDSDQPSMMAVTVKISALTSQHNHLFFRVRFWLKEHPEWMTMTDAIHVFSKPNQIACTNDAPRPARQPTRQGKKRTFNETLVERLDSLTAIQNKQRENLELLRRIAASVAPNSNFPTSAFFGAASPSADPLEAAFHLLVKAYHSTPVASRPEKGTHTFIHFLHHYSCC